MKLSHRGMAYMAVQGGGREASLYGVIHTCPLTGVMQVSLLVKG